MTKLTRALLREMRLCLRMKRAQLEEWIRLNKIRPDRCSDERVEAANREIEKIDSCLEWVNQSMKTVRP